jgi:uncharacterized UBP type Zn finger protein
MESALCPELSSIEEIKQPIAYHCDECIKTGSRWLHLRTCQTCGTTLCCDNSPNKHATQHYHATKHPVIISSEPGESWMYCYKHNEMAEY